MCEKVLDRCLAPSTAGGEGCDNMTMILVQFKKRTSSSEEVSADEKSCVAIKEIDSEEANVVDAASQVPTEVVGSN